MTATEQAQATSQAEAIGQAFDEMGELVEIQGGGNHVGYWYGDDDQAPFLEAINQNTELVGEKLELRPGQRLLDIGCGVAVPAIRYAQRYDVEVTGLTNSPWQVQEANRRTKAAGVRSQIRIDLGDAAALPYADASFDAVLSLQSLQHAEDRGRWLREMARVVRPGGRVVLVDFVEEIPLGDDEVEILFGNNVPMQRPLPYAQVVDQVRESGLVVDEALSCGDRIRRSYPAYWERVGRIKPDLVAMFGEERIESHLGFMRIMLPIYHDKIGYVIISARRPGGPTD
jgi:cyclopropane fatty-acyl-phospholipid synthase-like methyltransferase